MKKLKKHGFVLVLVIIVMALIGMVMFVLTEGANTMLFQSNRAYLEAVERNLIISSLTWAKQNIKSQKAEIFNKTIDLDIADLNIQDATLNIVVSPAPLRPRPSPGRARDKEAEVEISTSCSRGRRTLRHHDKYKIRISYKNQSNKTQI